MHSVYETDIFFKIIVQLCISYFKEEGEFLSLAILIAGPLEKLTTLKNDRHLFFQDNDGDNVTLQRI